MMIPEGPIGDKNESVLELAVKLEQFVRTAASEGQSLHEVEQKTLGTVLELGRRYVDLFIELQGDGDLGVRVTTEQGQELQRTEEPARRTLRTVFGTHTFSAYVYAPGPKQKIALRPLDARMSPGLRDPGNVCRHEPVVERLFGHEVAGATARHMEYPWQEPCCDNADRPENHR